MYTWIFEHSICPCPVDGRLYRFCLLRRPALLLFLFPRLLGMLLILFSEKAGSTLRWGFLKRLNAELIGRFWRKEAKRLPALSAASGQVWLTRLPSAAVMGTVSAAGVAGSLPKISSASSMLIFFMPWLMSFHELQLL